MMRWNGQSGSEERTGELGVGDGIFVNQLDKGAVLDIETRNRHYQLVKRDQDHVAISGHPTFCPQPVEVEIEGSVGRTQPMFSDPGYIGRGMRLVYKHPVFDIVTTSEILAIHARG